MPHSCTHMNVKEYHGDWLIFPPDLLSFWRLLLGKSLFCIMLINFAWRFVRLFHTVYCIFFFFSYHFPGFDKYVMDVLNVDLSLTGDIYMCVIEIHYYCINLNWTLEDILKTQFQKCFETEPRMYKSHLSSSVASVKFKDLSQFWLLKYIWVPERCIYCPLLEFKKKNTLIASLRDNLKLGVLVNSPILQPPTKSYRCFHLFL